MLTVLAYVAAAFVLPADASQHLTVQSQTCVPHLRKDQNKTSSVHHCHVFALSEEGGDPKGIQQIAIIGNSQFIASLIHGLKNRNRDALRFGSGASVALLVPRSSPRSETAWENDDRIGSYRAWSAPKISGSSLEQQGGDVAAPAGLRTRSPYLCGPRQRLAGDSSSSSSWWGTSLGPARLVSF